MSEMVGRLAKVIYNCPDSWTSEEIARAVIEAMREPTRKMLSAGGFCHIQGAGSVSESDMEIAKREWQSMIDEASK